MSKNKKYNFVTLCMQGEVLLEEIDDWIEKWHDSPQKEELYEYLGMSWSEYSAWVSMPEILPFIITAHRENREFTELLEELNELPMAARSNSKNEPKKLIEWLKSHKII
jgi:DNA-directed RNA polymerase specialized sigma subunit